MSRLINDLHPTLQALCAKHLALCSDAGLHVIVTQTYRSREEQAVLYSQGRKAPGPIVTWAPPGMSYHEYRLAYDIALLHDHTASWDVKADVNHNLISDYEEVGKIGESIGLGWGGRFTKRDYPHFQYTFGLTIAQLQGGEKVPDAT